MRELHFWEGVEVGEPLCQELETPPGGLAEGGGPGVVADDVEELDRYALFHNEAFHASALASRRGRNMK